MNPLDISASARRIASFGPYVVDFRAGEVRKFGTKLKIGEQPLQILRLLLENPGELVFREELRRKLWANDTFVDFDHGLNSAIQRLRDCVSDSAANPKWIETLPRRGYRFVGPVEWLNGSVPSPVNGKALARVAEIPANGHRNAITVPAIGHPATREPEVRTRPVRRPLGLVVGLAAALLLVAGLVANRMYTRPARSANQIKIVHLTSYLGAERSPSFSPDGNEIAFTWNGDLYRKQVGNEKAMLLTKNAMSPAWSPDGQTIAFARHSKDAAVVYTIPALGGAETRLGEASGVFWGLASLSWSPDSKWLAFTGPDDGDFSTWPSAYIELLNVETLQRIVLPRPSPECKTPALPTFSRDGHTLALMCINANQMRAIYVDPVSGGKARELEPVPIQGDIGSLVWSADNKSILYSLNGFLWRIPAAGGTPEKLSFGPGIDTLAVSPVGDRMAFVQQSFLRNNLRVRRLDLAGPAKPVHPPITIISSSQGEEEPRISPDGKHVAFGSGRSGSSEIWVAGIDGSNPLQLTSFGGTPTGTPRWSPDSQRIVFDSRASGRPELYIVNADGGPPRRLSTGTPDATVPSWSGDGQWIYFKVANETPGIWKVPSAGGASVRLTADPGLMPQEISSTRVGYEMDDQLKSVSVNGGDERAIAGLPKQPGPFNDAWTPTRAGIYFLDASIRPHCIQLLDLGTHRVRKVIDLPGRVPIWGAGPSVSADGRTLVWAEPTEDEADIMLVEGFK